MLASCSVPLSAAARPSRVQPRHAALSGGLSSRSSAAQQGSPLGQQRVGRRASGGAQLARRTARRQMSCSAFMNILEKKPKAEVPDVPPSGKWEYKYLYDGACSVCRGLVRWRFVGASTRAGRRAKGGRD